ncbi:MAG: Gfo/Idh/MocA family protein [Anaerolineales bacterium]
MTDTIHVGLIGTGFAGEIHAHAYQRVRDIDVKLAAVAASSVDGARAFAEEHNIPAHGTVDDLLARDDLDIVDLCVPNYLHEPLALRAMEGGRHVICEKPLTGYFGGEEAQDPVGATPKGLMLEKASASAERMVEAAREQGVKLMYAENWLYSPAIDRANRLAGASGGTILEIRAQECHSGSHAQYAKSWATSGGGALVRLASHPIGATLWLKEKEGLRRNGVPIKATSVLADVDNLCRVASLRREAKRHIVDDWEDVENWSLLVITFDDGTRGVIQGSDIVLGGMEDTLTVLLSNARIDCDLTHSGLIKAYASHSRVFEEEYIMEKAGTKAGWSYPSVDEEYLLGYPQEIRDFVESVVHDRSPRSTGRLGLEVVRLMYAAYQSAEEGRPISLPSS